MADTGIPSGQKLSGNIDKNISKQKDFNKELEITLQKANAILKAFGMPQMGAGSGGAGGSLTTSGTFTNGGAGGGSGVANFVKRTATAVAGVAAGAAQALPSVQEVLNTQLLTSQARFSGVANPIAAAQAAMRGGQATSPTDYLQAMQIGSQGGLTGALPGYSGILNGVSQISNLTGSGASAMRAAVGLNSAQSVNTLRMFGISERGANGAARNPADVFKDIYNFVSRQVGRKMTPQEVAISLQPGNGIANFLDAVSAGNPDLRNSLQLAAQQFAQGGDLSRASTNKTGATTAAQGKQSDLFAAQVGTQAAAAPAMSKGFIEGADLLIKFNTSMSDTLASSKLANDAVKQLAKAETIAADNIGKAGLSVLGVIASFIAGSSVLKNLKSGPSSGFNPAGTAGISDTAPAISKLLGPDGNPISITSTATSAAETAASAASKSGLLAKFLGPVGLYFTGKSLIGQTMDQFSASVITGKRVPDPTQGFWNSVLHGTRYVDKGTISGANPGSSGLGHNASVTSSPQSGARSVSAGSAAIMVAQTQLGTPYSWGGGSTSGPTVGMGSGTNTVGFDCSSFVRFVMAKIGVVLPRTSQEQQKCGTQINPMDAQPGDLLFIGYPAHHVMIYAGNGIAIEAPQTGDVVKRTGVDLRTITSCSRVINSKTGTKDLGNLLNSANGIQGFGSYAGGAQAAQVSIMELRGNTPKDAMSGGTSSSSGLGLGQSMSAYASTVMGSNNMSKHVFVNPKTGTLEESATAGGTVINYGGVKVDVKVPNGAKVTAQDIAKAVKAELKSLSISTKVANK
jgi:cell wall-associated NlpC family hydrolase